MNPDPYRAAIEKDGTQHHPLEGTMFTVSLRRFVGPALASLALMTAACGNDSDSTGPGSDPAPADASGTYHLTSLRSLSSSIHGGGNALPIKFTDPKGTTLVFKSGELVLAADGSYTLEVEAEFKGGDVTMSDEGNYSTAGGSIDFTPTGSPARMKDGTISGNKITAETQFGGIPFEIKVAR